MRFKKPKIIGELKIERMMAGNLAVKNNIKNGPNKIIITCNSYDHVEEIIERIKKAKFGETLHL